MECMKKIDIIVLAAGFSVRFGENKLLYPFYGKPMFEHIIDELKLINDEKVNNIIVVTQYEQIAEYAKTAGFLVRMNRDSRQGISSSIRLGIDKSIADAFLFVTADQPYLTHDSIQKLMNCFCQCKYGMAGVKAGKMLGSPNIFSNRYKDKLLNLVGDKGGRSIMRCYPQDVQYVEIDDPKQLLDIDEKNNFSLFER